MPINSARKSPKIGAAYMAWRNERERERERERREGSGDKDELMIFVSSLSPLSQPL